MKLTVSHGKTKQETIQTVDRAFDDVFKGLPVGPLQISDSHKSWNGSVLTFSLTAKMGLLRNPVHGTVEVNDKDLTIDVDLGLLSKLLPENKARAEVESRVKRLLA